MEVEVYSQGSVGVARGPGRGRCGTSRASLPTVVVKGSFQLAPSPWWPWLGHLAPVSPGLLAYSGKECSASFARHEDLVPTL